MRRATLLSLLAVAAFGAVGSEKPLAKIGIVSDTHVTAETNPGGAEAFGRVRRFYSLFSREGVDMIVNCGDISWNFEPAAYERYAAIRREAYPDPAKAPREIYVWADHDENRFPKEGYRGHAAACDAVREILGIPNRPEEVFPFRGFTFVVMPQNPFDPKHYEDVVAAACAKDPSKPVFLIEHEPGLCTTQNSQAWGSPERREILSRYPQVIAINGHSHGTLRDERNIWQGAYTSVSAACLSHWQSDVVGVPVKTMWNHSCLLAELHADRIVFHRRDLDEDCEIGKPWTVTWPFDPKTAPYAPERRFAASAPEFPAGAAVQVGKPDAAGRLPVTFPAATDADGTHVYRITYATEDGRTVAVREVFGEYHLPAAKRTGRLADAVEQEYFGPGSRIRVTVAPRGFGGQAGRALETAIAVPAYARRPVLWTGTLEGLTDGVGTIPGNYGIPQTALANAKPGSTVRVVADFAFEQGLRRPVNFQVRSREPGLATPWINTLPGNSDLRYVIDFKVPETGCPKLDVRFRQGDPGKVRVRRLTFLGEMERPVLKVGLLSDTHVRSDPRTLARTREAFKVFRTQGVDVVAHLGDIAEWCYPEAYANYRAAMDEAFPPDGKRPQFLYAFGNHDALKPPEESGPRLQDLPAAFRTLRARLDIQHGYTDLKVIAGYPFLIFPETLTGDIDLSAYERKIAETCERFPDRPVFVLEHPPAYDTVYNSWFDDPRRRAVLDRFPQVVEIAGHKHSSVNNERSIWQGTFTAIQASGLEEWYGLNVGTHPVAKQGWGVIVLEVFPNRLVFRRYDVRDGVEYRPEVPWTVSLPFAASAQAPYSVSVRRAQERPASFAPGARPTVTPDGTPFSSVTVRFPTVTRPEDVQDYRVTIARQADGRWTDFALADVFGDFSERPQDRTGERKVSFDAVFFEPGETYRLSVTPRGFFGMSGQPISCVWTAPQKARAEVVWECANPMDTQTVVGAGRRENGWFVSEGGEVRIDLPPGIVRGRTGDRFRFTADVRIDQASCPVGAAFGVVPQVRWNRGVLTAKEPTQALRYTVTEPFGEGASEWAFRLGGPGKRRIRFERLMVEVFAKPCSSGEARTPPLRRCGVSPHHNGDFASTSVEKVNL